MATKYVRKSYQYPSRAHQNREGRISLLSTADPKRRLMRIYIGIGMFAAALYVFHFTGLNDRLAWQPATEGRGIVVEKTIEDEASAQPRYLIGIAIEVPVKEDPVAPGDPTTRSMVDRIEVTGEDFQQVNKGTALVVRYQTTYSRDKIHIQEILLSNPADPAETTPDETPGIAPNPEIQ